jgi:hypothetical protein
MAWEPLLPLRPFSHQRLSFHAGVVQEPVRVPPPNDVPEEGLPAPPGWAQGALSRVPFVALTLPSWNAAALLVGPRCIARMDQKRKQNK